jgi:DNA modification methylase
MRKLSDIKLNDDNPRFINDERFEKLIKSIQEFPKMLKLRPIIVDKNGIILAGNMRYRALKHLDYKSVPDEWIKCADELNEEEKRRFIVVDNIGYGQWDYDLLANEWDPQELEEWGLELPEDFELSGHEPKDDEYEIPDDIKTDIVLGDLIEIGPHRLLCGDSAVSDNLEKLMNGEKADIVFTDPDFSIDDNLLFSCYSNTLIHSKECFSFWICSDKQAVKLAMNDFNNFTHFFIHNFKVPTLVSNTAPMQKHNLICKFGNKKMKNLKDGFSTIIDVATERTTDFHKTTRMSKRVELPSLVLSHYAEKGEIVLDIFGHSGSTMVAAHSNSMICYMMEIEPKYCQFIIDRMKRYDSELEIKINGIQYKGIEGKSN